MKCYKSFQANTKKCGLCKSKDKNVFVIPRTVIEKYPKNDLRYENIGVYIQSRDIFSLVFGKLGIYFMLPNNIQPTCHNFPTKLSQIYASVSVCVEYGAVSDLDAIQVYK